REQPTVLTPHEGELARLLEVESDEVKAHRLDHVREAAELSGAVVLLKGDDTIVAVPGGPEAISAGGTPALATAGTGAVRSGLSGGIGRPGRAMVQTPAHVGCQRGRVRGPRRHIHQTGHTRLPVVDDGQCVGVVTRIDVLGALASE